MKKRYMTAAALLLGLSMILSACSLPAGSKTEEAPTDAPKTTAAPTEAPETDAPTEAPATEPEETSSEFDPSDAKFLETKNLAGEQVFLGEVCAAHTLTMVNFWASWCPPCVGELPELEAIWQKYKDAGLAVVGVLLDGNEKQGLEDGLALMENAGVTYLNVLPTRELQQLTDLQYIPTTIFLDENGDIVGTAIVGADPEAYEARIAAALGK